MRSASGQTDLQNLDPPIVDTLRRVILRMVALESQRVARRRVPMDELRYGQDDPEQARIEAVIGRLREARLVVSSKDNERTLRRTGATSWCWDGRSCGKLHQAEQEIIPLHRLVTQEATAWVQKIIAQRQSLVRLTPRLPLVGGLQNKEP